MTVMELYGETSEIFSIEGSISFSNLGAKSILKLGLVLSN